MLSAALRGAVGRAARSQGALTGASDAQRRADGARILQTMGPVQWIQLKYYQYKLTSALYMLEPWEQALFSTPGRRFCGSLGVR